MMYFSDRLKDICCFDLVRIIERRGIYYLENINIRKFMCLGELWGDYL